MNVDLIYGLPHQTEAGFVKTLDRVLEASQTAFRFLIMRICRVYSRRRKR
ncbi:hypothetical protein THIOSC15_2950004 [uncultured Thiomicrorhabdus sp.]